MKVSEVMTTDVQVIGCDGSLRQAAEMMKSCDIGSLPVSRDERLVGMLTDRDIVIRAVAEGLGGDCPVSKVMSEDLKFCYADETVEQAANTMSDLGVRRLPVIDRNEKLVGFMSLSNVASADKPAATENLLQGTACPH
jgi:CBS domain-containing protein